MTLPPSRPSLAQVWQHRLLGTLVPMLVAGLFIAATASYWPEGAFLGTFGRMFDSLAPQLLAATLGLALLVFCLGGRRVAGVAAVLVLASALSLTLRHLSVAAPLAEDSAPEGSPAGALAAPLRVVWFNVLFTNPLAPEKLATEITASEADLVVLAESRNLARLCALLRPEYPYQIGCDTPGADLRLLSRLPLDGRQSERIDTARPGPPAAQPDPPARWRRHRCDGRSYEQAVVPWLCR